MDLLPGDQPFRRALDLLDSGVGFFQSDLTLIFGNRYLRRTLMDDGALARRVQDLVRTLAVRCGASPGDGEVRAMVDETVEVDGKSFRLRGGCVGMDVWSTGSSLVVTVEPAFRQPASSADLPLRRFKLTRREADIAMLLAEGRTNEEIAQSLFLSPHTIRNYTRRVLRKLGVRNRAQVGPRLRAPE